MSNPQAFEVPCGRRHGHTWLSLALLALVGCSSSPGSNDAGSGPETGARADAGSEPSGDSPEAQACEERDLECASGFCDPYRGCVDCIFDSDCAADQRCGPDLSCEPAPRCQSNADCAETPETGACDLTLGYCKLCVEDFHCGEAGTCDDGRCTGYTPCVNSFDCDDGAVCDRASERCVECVGDGDCGEQQRCANQVCVAACDSDRDCLAAAQLCDFRSATDEGVGHCADCIEDADCPDTYFCRDNECHQDACIAGEIRCHPTSNDAQVCAPNGARWEDEPCEDGFSCGLTDGQAACIPWVCVPGSASCADGIARVPCAEDGLSTLDPEECSEDGSRGCVRGSCIDTTCVPDSIFCDSGDVRACSVDGQTSQLYARCTVGTHCDSGEEACVDNVCEPDEAYCDGEVRLTCDGRGAGPIDDREDCSESGELCALGQCAPEICEVGAERCTDGVPERCAARGTAWERIDTCAANEYCDADPDTGARCRLHSCTPNQPACDGDIAGTCNAEGSALLAGGTNCSAADSVCIDGACEPIICRGTRDCVGGNVETCREQGTVSARYDTCLTSEYCEKSGAYAYCRTDVCSPGETGCAGNTVGTCRADGSGYDATGTDCSLSDQVCYGPTGSCLPQLCEPSDYFCKEGNVYRCGEFGATDSLSRTCLDSSYCDDSPERAICATDVCDQGELDCDGDVLRTCNTDGSGFEGEGTDCTATDEACRDAACHPVICTPGATSCSADQTGIRECDTTGTRWLSPVSCAVNEYCDDSVEPSCVSDLCPASTVSCLGEQVGTCAAHGGALEGTVTSCASDEVCNESEMCAEEAVDSYMNTFTDGSLSNYLVGATYRVSTDRVLTQMEFYGRFSSSGTRIMSFAVYESDSLSGQYTLVSRTDATASAVSNQWLSSGSIDVPLAAGKYYRFVFWSDSSFAIERYTYGAASWVSFGYRHGGAQHSATTVPATLSGYWNRADTASHRLTTVAAP